MLCVLTGLAWLRLAPEAKACVLSVWAHLGTPNRPTTFGVLTFLGGRGLDELYQDPMREIGQTGGRGDGQYPRPKNSVYDTEVEGVEALCAADTHDTGGDGVGGGDRHAEGGRDAQDGRSGGLCGEAVHGLQFHHFMTHGLDDFPATCRGSCRHHDGTDDFDPDGDNVTRVRPDPEE